MGKKWLVEDNVFMFLIFRAREYRSSELSNVKVNNEIALKI